MMSGLDPIPDQEIDVKLRDVVTIAVIVLSILVVLLAGGLAYTLGQVASQGNETAKQSESVERVVGRQADLLGAIQAERVRNVREQCVSQNARNRNTKDELEDRAGNVSKARLEATAALIDALVPYRDCDQVVLSQTGQSATEGRGK